MAFITDLSNGLQAEDFVINVFEAHGYKVIKKATGYFPPYDFACLNRAEKIKKIEIKYDRQAHKTGNLFYEQKALEHSEADVLVYCYGQPISHLYFYHLPTLYATLRGIEPNVRGGDNGDYGWLFPKDKLNAQIVEV